MDKIESAGNCPPIAFLLSLTNIPSSFDPWFPSPYIKWEKSLTLLLEMNFLRTVYLWKLGKVQLELHLALSKPSFKC